MTSERRRISMRTTFSVVAMLVMLGAFIGAAVAADLKPIKTQKTKDVTVSLLSESGQWKPGKNDFVLAFTKDGKPVDAGKVSVNTSMPMPGMAPMVAGATLKPDAEPGRYRGTISFPDSGDRQVTVRWDGPAGKGSTKFSVPVR
jgi:YtkA-like